MKIKLVKATRVEALPDYRLRTEFSDRTVGVTDLSDFILSGGDMVEPLKDPAFFGRVFIDMGVPTWPNGLDVDPTNLRMELEASGQLRPVSEAA